MLAQGNEEHTGRRREQHEELQPVSPRRFLDRNDDGPDVTVVLGSGTETRGHSRMSRLARSSVVPAQTRDDVEEVRARQRSCQA